MKTKMLNQLAGKTYFGFAAFIVSILCVLSRLYHISVSYMNISMETFDKLNSLTALIYCILTPLAFSIGVYGFTRKNDSRAFSIVACVIVFIPFIISFVQMLGAISISK